MTDTTQAPPTPAVPARWREASDRLRSNARLFVVSLGAVAVTVVAGLSLTGLSTLEPGSANFALAVAGALVATIGVVALLALAMRLSAASAVSVGDLLALGDGAASAPGLWWRRTSRRGYWTARTVVGKTANGYIAGFETLEQFAAATVDAQRDQRDKAQLAAASPDDAAMYASYVAASRKAAWFEMRLGALAEVASFQRLRWNFGATAAAMTVIGVLTAAGIVTYAAALQPRDVPTSPVAVTTHESIRIDVPESPAAASLFESVVGCAQPVDGLVLGVGDASVSAITIPEGSCRSVTLNAVWDGTSYVAAFDLADAGDEPEVPAPSATP